MTATDSRLLTHAIGQAVEALDDVQGASAPPSACCSIRSANRRTR